MTQERFSAPTITLYNLTGQTEFTVPFEYLARKFVVLTLRGATNKTLTMGSDYRFVNTTTISLSSVPASEFTQLEVRRYTSATERLVNFQDGSILRAGELNMSTLQSIHVAEEARDLTLYSVGLNEDGHLDAKGRRIVRLADGVLPTDAATVGQIEEIASSGGVSILREQLASSGGAGIIGHGSKTVDQELTEHSVKLQDVTAVSDFGISTAAADNAGALLGLRGEQLVRPVDAGMERFATSSLEGAEQTVNAKYAHGNAVYVQSVDPAIFGARYSHFSAGGEQLSKLRRALNDPLYQKFGICFIGDSITWGVGATGSLTSGPARDGTLGDYRNIYEANTYVNIMRRWVKDVLGAGVTEELSNHPYAPSGESISIFKKTVAVFPMGPTYQFSKSGSATDVIKTQVSGPALAARREITVNGSGVGLLSFPLTGDSLTVVFAGIPSGADYELIVAGESKGTFSTYSAGATYNQKHNHTFDYVSNAVVTLKVKVPSGGTGNKALYLEGLEFAREIRVSNQGISGASSQSYLTYNFPASLHSNLIKKLDTMSGLGEAPTGVGATNLEVKEVADSSTGEQRRYSFLQTSSWDITFSIPAGNDQLMIGYSCLAATGAIDVYGDNNLIGRVHTSDLHLGNVTGYGRIATLTIPATVTNIKLTLVYENLTGATGVNFVYLEGVGYKKSSDVEYPDNNGFNKGVCLKYDDKFAFIQIGINDRASNRCKAPESLEDGLEGMLARLPVDCAPILMCSNPAVNTASHAYDSYQVRNAILKVSKRNKVDFIDNHSLFGKCPLRFYTTDDLHPNDVGHALIAQNITHALENADYCL
ncbi:MAG: phage tail fiber protein [Plesiomonas sp.]